MKIKIWDNKYIIKSDSRQYKLIELKGKTDTENTEEKEDEGVCIAYLDSITSVFRVIVEREGRQNNCTTLNGYIKHLEKINNQLEKTLKAIAAVVGQRESLRRIMDAMPEELPESIAKIGEGKKE